MKLPDGNKPIHIGDHSFIYKNVYHPITWLGEDPYRPRVETLVIKDGKYLYANIDDDINQVTPNRRTHSYSIPGGSVDSDSTKIQQAEAETNEEALISIDSIYPTGIQYYDLYEPGFLLKGGDMPLEYVGSVSDVFCARYTGPYDKSKVEEKDLDPKMAEHGKFHEITAIAKYLRKEHIQALVNCPFLDPLTKASINQSRHDTVSESLTPETGDGIVIPGGKVYHGSKCKFDVFHPMSLDLGNVYQPPGWSTFVFDEYETAKDFAFMRAFNEFLKNVPAVELIPCHDELEMRYHKGQLTISKKCLSFLQVRGFLDDTVKFYVYTIDASKVSLSFGNDSSLKEYTFRDDNVVPEKIDEFNISIADMASRIEVIEDSIQSIKPSKNNDYSNLLTHDYSKEQNREKLEDAVSKGDLKPGDDIVAFMRDNNIAFDGDDIKIPELTIDIDEPVLENTTIVFETEYPISCYGLPDRKAYPMPDKRHVKSAIRFFNYAKPEEEKELATAILKKIKEFNMTDVSVGEKNRFGKYYRTVQENFSLQDFIKGAESCLEIINNKETPTQERYETYSKMRGLTNMLIQQASIGAFEEMDTSATADIINAGYNTLAEIAQNQMEIMSTMEGVSVVSKMDPNHKDKLTYQLGMFKKIRGLGKSLRTDYPDLLKHVRDEASVIVWVNRMSKNPVAMVATEKKPDGIWITALEITPSYRNHGLSEQVLHQAKTELKATRLSVNKKNEIAKSLYDKEGFKITKQTEAMYFMKAVSESVIVMEADDDKTIDETPTDYTADGDTNEGDTTDPEPTEGEEDTTEDGTDDTDGTTEDGEDTTDTTTEETPNAGENTNRFDNNGVKNYFLLKDFISMHELITDVLDTIVGVILPTPDGNTAITSIVKALQELHTFVESFTQFQFSDSDYKFNLYYYEIAISGLKIVLKMVETVFADVESDNKKNRRIKNA